jgi:hypothetical protein
MKYMLLLTYSTGEEDLDESQEDDVDNACLRTRIEA